MARPVTRFYDLGGQVFCFYVFKIFYWGQKNLGGTIPECHRRLRAWLMRLSRTHAVLGKAILGEWVPMSGIVRILVVFSNHSALHR